MVEEGLNPFERGPFLQMAVLCEKVLQEADGTISLIRVVDRISHAEQGPNAPAEMPEIKYNLSLIVALKPGVLRGRHDVTITLQRPSGETAPPITRTVQLEGATRGVNLVNIIDLTLKLEGVYWFLVKFDQTPLTRVPLEVQYERLTAG